MSTRQRQPATRGGRAPRDSGAQPGAAPLDDTDRRLLALLAEDATRTYAELGKLLFLSAPAVHERARRLKKEGVIKATVAALDAAKLNRPLLAFVHVDTTSWAVTRQLLALEELPEVEEIHTVTGESAMLLKVRTRNTQSLEQLLARIHAIEGFTGTRSYIALTTYLERGPSPAL
ncbi:transcriptional regulator, AsnC family [Burkholderia sp. WP9]|jgi:DNA-binding Lrp family transcriptional regulator|uniref:Lrp/AsnC family transcriptional regulator n=1 Tax=Burkholderiaceae TaxID=119060 RepID=UPI00089536D4|nr:Lrp/AsnC family transcriptional regulator [Burkholderia sp. WP9]SEB76765.1 transcriptional regulator, AsnC family [Burkholderia sp. WP9]